MLLGREAARFMAGGPIVSVPDGLARQWTAHRLHSERPPRQRYGNVWLGASARWPRADTRQSRVERRRRGRPARLFGPELDKSVTAALRIRIEEARAVTDLDRFDRLPGFQADRAKRGTPGHPLPFPEHIAGVVGVDHLDAVQRDGAVLHIEAQVAEAPIARNGDDVGLVSQAAADAHKQWGLTAKVKPTAVGRGKSTGSRAGLEPALGVFAPDLQARLAATGWGRIDEGNLADEAIAVDVEPGRAFPRADLGINREHIGLTACIDDAHFLELDGGAERLEAQALEFAVFPAKLENVLIRCADLMHAEQDRTLRLLSFVIAAQGKARPLAGFQAARRRRRRRRHRAGNRRLTVGAQSPELDVGGSRRPQMQTVGKGNVAHRLAVAAQLNRT